MVVFITSLFNGEWNPMLDFINAVSVGINVAIQTVFWITLTFVMLERSPDSAKELEKSWNLDMLPELPPTRQINRAETLVGVVMLGLFAAFMWSLNTNFWENNNQVVTVLNFVHPEAWKFWIPAFIGVLILEIIHHIFRYVIGNWTVPLVVTEVVINILTVVVMIGWLTSGQVVNPELYTFFEAKGVQNIHQIVDWSIYLAIAIGVVTSVIESIDAITKSRVKSINVK